MREQVQRLLSWHAALGELAIVVVGVIIALGVGSWWDQKQERRLEAEHLVELRIESARNLEELRSTLARMDTLKANTLILIEVVEGARPAPPVDSLVELTWLSFSFATYNPLSTAYDNLLSSGGIQLIRDEGLKRDLALFNAHVEGLQRQDWVLDQWNRIIQPWVISNFQLDWLAPSYREEHGVLDPLVQTDWGAVLQDQEFKGIVINRLIAITDYMAGLYDLLPAAEAVVDRLEGLAPGPVGVGAS